MNSFSGGLKTNQVAKHSLDGNVSVFTLNFKLGGHSWEPLAEVGLSLDLDLKSSHVSDQ